LLDRNTMWHPTILMRRAAFLTVGGYRSIIAAEDYDLWLRIAGRFQLSNLSEVVLRYRLHTSQISETARSQMWLGALGSRGAALARLLRMSDPINQSHRITPDMIPKIITLMRPAHRAGRDEEGMGQQTGQDHSCLRWLRQAAELNSECLDSAIDVLCSPDWQKASRQIAAEANYTLARLYLRRRIYLKSATAATRAALGWPPVVAHLLSPLRQILESADACEAARKQARAHPFVPPFRTGMLGVSKTARRQERTFEAP
jgi:hypothetical protein